VKNFKSAHIIKRGKTEKGTRPYNHEEERRSGERRLSSARDTNTEWQGNGESEELRVGYK
jgi:hypothetical protein